MIIRKRKIKWAKERGEMSMRGRDEENHTLG
jgi:hypothetical protein